MLYKSFLNFINQIIVMCNCVMQLLLSYVAVILSHLTSLLILSYRWVHLNLLFICSAVNCWLSVLPLFVRELCICISRRICLFCFLCSSCYAIVISILMKRLLVLLSSLQQVYNCFKQFREGKYLYTLPKGFVAIVLSLSVNWIAKLTRIMQQDALHT